MRNYYYLCDHKGTKKNLPMQPFATKHYLKEVISSMNVGEIVSLPIEKTVNARVCASQVGLSNCRKYRTFTVPNERVVKVERLK